MTLLIHAAVAIAVVVFACVLSIAYMLLTGQTPDE